MSKPIVVQVTRGPNKGAEYGYASEAVATKHLGDGGYKILRHTDTSAYEPPARTTDGPSTETTEAKDKK
jgi:hypothetical protein